MSFRRLPSIFNGINSSVTTVLTSNVWPSDFLVSAPAVKALGPHVGHAVQSIHIDVRFFCFESQIQQSVFIDICSRAMRQACRIGPLIFLSNLRPVEDTI